MDRGRHGSLWSEGIQDRRKAEERNNYCHRRVAPHVPPSLFDGANYLVVWTVSGASTEVRGQFISKAGTKVRSSFSLGTTDSTAIPPVVFFDGKKYVVTIAQLDTGTMTFNVNYVTKAGVVLRRA